MIEELSDTIISFQRGMNARCRSVALAHVWRALPIFPYICLHANAIHLSNTIIGVVNLSFIPTLSI